MPITSGFRGLQDEQDFEELEKNRITYPENPKIMQIMILTKRSSPDEYRQRIYP